MKNDAFDEIAERYLKLVGERLKNLQQAALDPNARLGANNIFHVTNVTWYQHHIKCNDRSGLADKTTPATRQISSISLPGAVEESKRSPGEQSDTRGPDRVRVVPRNSGRAIACQDGGEIISLPAGRQFRLRCAAPGIALLTRATLAQLKRPHLPLGNHRDAARATG